MIVLWNHTKDCHIYWFDVLGLLRSNHGEFCNLCVLFNEIWWFRCKGYSDCYSFVNYCRHWVGNKKTCCFRELLQRCHSACSVPFRWVVNECCDCFCRRWWYDQGFVSDDWLRFGGCLNWGCFNLHRQVGEMYKSVCRVNDYTVVHHKMQSNYWPC